MKVSRLPTLGESNTPTDSAEVTTEATDSPQDPEGELQSVPELDKDAIFSLLKNHRRRKVLHYLTTHEGEAPLGTVAEHIAAIENDTTVQQINSQQRKRVYVALYQCHLPTLDDYGVINFNRPRGQLKLAPNITQLEPYLENSGTETKPWSPYLIVTIFGGLLYLFGGLLVGPGSLFTTVTIVGLLITLATLAIHEGRNEIITAVRASTRALWPHKINTVVGSMPGDSANASNDTVTKD